MRIFNTSINKLISNSTKINNLQLKSILRLRSCSFSSSVEPNVIDNNRKKIVSSVQPLLMARLEQHVKRTRYLEQMLINLSLGPESLSEEQIKQINQERINPQKARLELNKLASSVTLFEQLSSLLNNAKDIQQMLKEIQPTASSNQQKRQEKQFLLDQLQQIMNTKQEVIDDGIRLLVSQDAYDDVEEVILEFRAGAGGSQSALFVQDASNMILGYCTNMGWKTQITSSIKDSNTNQGYRSLNMKVMGPDSYKLLKCQSGVHKVIRVPQTENKGRLHSSTISLAVIPSVPFDFSVNQKDIRYQYMKSSGPGGQSVNKTESACRAVHIPTNMSVMIQEDRSQDRNRKRATDILKQRLFEIQYKKNVEEQTRKRKSQIGTMDRSQKIRTYNYPQDRITDHRTGLTLYGIQLMMGGQYLEKFIGQYQDKIYQQKLKVLLDELKTETIASVQ